MATSRLANKVRTNIKRNKAKEVLDMEQAAAAAAASNTAQQAKLQQKKKADVVVQAAEEGSVKHYTSIQGGPTFASGK